MIGSQLVVLALETAARKPLPEAFKEGVNAFASLLFLFAFSRVLLSDIVGLTGGGAIAGAVGDAAGALGRGVAVGAREYGPSIAVGVALSVAANRARRGDETGRDPSSSSSSTTTTSAASGGKRPKRDALIRQDLRGPPWSGRRGQRTSGRGGRGRPDPKKPSGRQGRKRRGDGRPSADDEDVSGRRGWWRGSA